MWLGGSVELVVWRIIRTKKCQWQNRQMHFPNFDSERFQHLTFELQSRMVTLGEDVDWSRGS